MDAQHSPIPPIIADDEAHRPPPTWRVNRFGDRVLDAVNGEAFDRLGARLTLEEAFRDQLLREDTLYLIAGSDSGHLLEHVKRQAPPAGTRYLFVDLPSVHDTLRAAGLFEDLPPHIRCAPADAWAEAAQALSLSDYLYIDGVEVVASLAAQSPDIPEYVSLAWELREAAASLRWRTVAVRGSEAFITCQLDNAADNVYPAGVWRGALAGRTGVLLAGGPSLDDALDWVKAHRERLVVLAVSRISRRLLDVGLEPDFLFSVDPTEMSYEISRDMLRFGESVAFIHQYHVNPRLLAQWPHRSYYLGNVLPWTSKLNPSEPLLGVGPTVTNTALAFAGALGLARVILAGVDLCFTPEGYTHARGSNERAVGPRFDLTPLTVDTNAGQRACTTADFAAAAQTLSQQALYWRSQGLEIYNPATGAARMEGVMHLPLEQIALEGAALARPLAPSPSVQDTDETRLLHAQRVVRAMQRKLDEIKALEGELRHARRVVDKLFQADGSIQNRNLRKRLDKLEASIDVQHRETANLIRQCSTHAFLRAMRTTRDVDSLDAAGVQQALAAYYDTYLEGAERLRTQIERGLDRARLRAQEYAQNTPLSALAPRWLTYREPGRWRRWTNRRNASDLPLSPDEQRALQTLQDACQADLQSTGGAHLARARAHADLRAARVRMEELFSRRDAKALRDLIAGLEQAQDADAARSYQALAQGLLAELEEREDDALAHYDAVLQSEQRSLWPLALLRVANWALRHQHTEHARQALECLASLTPRYLLPYADVLAAIGDLSGAIGEYEKYLTDHPDDIHAMARLARSMAHAGHSDAARVMIEHIERVAPGVVGRRNLHDLIDSPKSAINPE